MDINSVVLGPGYRLGPARRAQPGRVASVPQNRPTAKRTGKQLRITILPSRATRAPDANTLKPFRFEASDCGAGTTARVFLPAIARWHTGVPDRLRPPPSHWHSCGTELARSWHGAGRSWHGASWHGASWHGASWHGAEQPRPSRVRTAPDSPDLMADPPKPARLPARELPRRRAAGAKSQPGPRRQVSCSLLTNHRLGPSTPLQL